MRSLLIADRDLSMRESALLHRLVIGLLDAGVHVTLAAPEAVIDRIEPSLGVEILPYRLRGAPWTRSLRARDLLERFQEATAVSEGEPGLVHAFGPACFGMASDIARAGDLGLVLEVHARAAASKAAAVVNAHSRCVLLAGSRGLVQLCVQSGVPASGVRERQWGVAIPVSTRLEPSEQRPVSIAIGGPGRDPEAWRQAIRGVANVAGRHEPGTVLLDAEGAAASGVSRLVAQLGLSPLVSRVPDFEARRELVVQADVLLWPERLGEVRSFVIDALASRVAVIAVEDSLVPSLSSPAHARLISGEASDWADALEELVTDLETRKRLGEAGFAYTQEHHRAATHVSGVVDAYEWCVGSDSIAIGIAE